MSKTVSVVFCDEYSSEIGILLITYPPYVKSAKKYRRRECESDPQVDSNIRGFRADQMAQRAPQ
jgi:hypothetical protein